MLACNLAKINIKTNKHLVKKRSRVPPIIHATMINNAIKITHTKKSCFLIGFVSKKNIQNTDNYYWCGCLFHLLQPLVGAPAVCFLYLEFKSIIHHNGMQPRRLTHSTHMLKSINLSRIRHNQQ